MNYLDPTGRPCYPDNDAGEAAAEDNCSNSIADMFGFAMISSSWCGEEEEGAPWSWKQSRRSPASACRRPQFKPPLEARVPEVPPGPPSEDEMATWLYAIVKGEEHDYGRGHGGCTDSNSRHAPLEKSSDTSTETQATSKEKNEKVPAAESTATKETGSDSTKTLKKKSETRSHHGVTHNLTEKRRRCKINESIKTLQHLVPRCDKSNFNSTLEHTIRYMKTLQEQIQFLAGDPSRPVAAVHPVVQPQYVPPGPPVTLAPMVVFGSPQMVPLGPVVPLPHYPASVVMMPAAETSLYPATTAPRFAPPADSLSRGSGSSMRGKE